MVSEKQKLMIFRIVGRLIVFALLVVIILPNFIRPCCGGQLTACKSNLKNIGTALEMYSSDYQGRYPRNLNVLVPEYLRLLPECPTSGRNTYRATFGKSAPFNHRQFEDFYLVECTGSAHTNVHVPPNYPKYSGLEGLIER